VQSLFLFLAHIVFFPKKGPILSIKTPKGTRDFFPDYQVIQDYIFDKWKEACLLSGYQGYEGPMFEHLELYTGKSGDEIVDQLYTLQDKKGRDLALRPEMTPTLARMINQKGPSLKKPAKWFSIPRLFRYEKAQKGRLREFFQLNLDIMGCEGIEGEVDLLLAITRMLKSFGLTQADFQIGISSRSILSALLKQRNVDNDAGVYAALDKKAKSSPEAFAKLLSEAGLNEEDQSFFADFMNVKNLTELKPFCQTEEATAAFDELNSLFETLNKLGAGEYIALDLHVVRGLAYYTGVVFEVFDKAKSMRAIAGGGRYDNLTKVLGGQAVTGVGFGMGDVVLRDLLEEKGLLPESLASQTDVFVATFNSDTLLAFEVSENLRDLGLKSQHSLKSQKIKKQLDLSNYFGAKYVLFADAEANTDGKFEVKNLKTGEQNMFSLNELAEACDV
jgi:histidyl-tRNA synthetase